MKKLFTICFAILMGLGAFMPLTNVAQAAVGDVWVDEQGNEYVETTQDDPNATHEIVEEED